MSIVKISVPLPYKLKSDASLTEPQVAQRATSDAKRLGSERGTGRCVNLTRELCPPFEG